MRIAIVGGGIGGLSLAHCLEHFGFKDYTLFERAPAFGEVGAALSIWPNALRVFQALGILGELEPHWGRILEASIRDDRGTILGQMAPDYDLPAVCMHRADLHNVLRSGLPQDRLIHSHHLLDFEELETDKIRLHFKDQPSLDFDILIGADGINSVVRQKIINDGPPIFRGYNVWRGIATDLDIRQGYASETWGKGARIGIVPIKDGKYGWWATLNEPMDQSDEPEGSLQKLNRIFADWHSPIPDLFSKSPKIIKNTLADRIPRSGWSHNRAVLMGDAAHPTTPNLGQGACMAIEGAYLLAHCLGAYKDPKTAFKRYEDLHYPRTSQVIRQSLINGKVGQLENSIAISIRNGVIRALPSRVTAHMLDKYFSYDVTRVRV